MKLLKLSLLMVLVSLFAACGDDDSSDCAQSDWVGTYTGTVVCEGVSETADIMITASGSDKLILTYETPTIEAEFAPFEFSGCDVSESGTSSGVTLNLDGSLDGNTLSLTEVISSSVGTSTCIINGTK